MSAPLVPRNTPASILLSPLATPTGGPPRGPGCFTIACSCTIAAPPAVCLAAVRDAAAYPLWNYFIRRCVVEEQPGRGEGEQEQEPASAGDGDGGGAGAAAVASRGAGFLNLGTAFAGEYFLDPEANPGTAASGTQKLEVSRLEVIDEAGEEGEEQGRRRKGFRIAWRTRGLLRLGLRSERVQEFVEADVEGGAGTEYVCWETFYGPLAVVTRLTVGRSLLRGFDAWGDGLKRRAEQLVRGGAVGYVSQ